MDLDYLSLMVDSYFSKFFLFCFFLVEDFYVHTLRNLGQK